MNEHRSRFKAYLINSTELKSEAVKLKPHLEECQRAFAQGEISGAEWATLFVLIYLNQRSSTSWWMKKSQPWGSEPAYFLRYWLREFQLKKLPESVARTLYFWMQGKYSIELQQSFISPYEMLKHQARGSRVVTLAQACAVEGESVDGARDAFEFLLHDLVHADLFFSDPQKFAEQKSFFSSLLCLVENDFLQEAQKIDSQFQQDFNYLISDMNSHPAHLAAMLKASYIKHLLFLEGKDAKSTLSAASQVLLGEEFKNWQRVGKFDFQLTNI